MRLALLTVLVLFACVAPSASSQGASAPPCTSGASSVVYGEPAVTTWYPTGCVHP
jgi:hypothetical protein